MSDMIQHHAQAVLIAGWIPTHGASDALRRLGERIVVGQQDEQALMTRWLRSHNAPIPGADSSHTTTPGARHTPARHAAAMPGMLTTEQLAQLDKARGHAFDRLFLTFMITHHEGALVMVDRLLTTSGAAQDHTVFALASDIQAEQSVEIKRMQQMLEALPAENPVP